MAFLFVAHVKGIAVGEIFWDVSIVGKRDVRTLLRQTYAESVIFKSMWEQANSSFLAATDDSE
jgi:hypothetical protein